MAELSHFRAARNPGAPGEPQSPRKKPRKTVIFIGGVWEFDTLHAAGIPGFHVPKTADFCDLLLGEFDAA